MIRKKEDRVSTGRRTPPMPTPSCAKTRPSRHRRKNCASRNQARILAREQVTRRPPTLDCGSTHRCIGCVTFIIIIVGTLSISGGTVQRSEASGQAPSLSSAVIRPRVLRDRRGGHALVHNSDRGRELAWPRLPSSDHLAVRHPERCHGVENLAPDPCLNSLCRQPSRSHR